MKNYINKRQNVKKGMFAKLNYIPNKLVYITEIDKNYIHFVGFYSENKENEFKVRESCVHKQCIKDFQTIEKCYDPNEKVKVLLKKYLK